MNAKKVVDLAERRRLREFLSRCDEAASRIKYYKLGPDHAVVATTRDEFAAMYGDNDLRRVAETMVDGVRVSTVFLGLDHRFIGVGPPIVFESMTFPDAEIALETDCDRYATWDEAVAGHAAMVRKVRNKVVQLRRENDGA